MSDNKTIAEDTTEAVDVSAKIDIKIKDSKPTLPVDVEKNKASESAVVGDGKGVGSIVSDNKAVDTVVSVGSKTVDPTVSNEGKAVESVVAGDSKAVKSEITVDTTLDPIVVDDASNEEPPSCLEILRGIFCKKKISKSQKSAVPSLDSQVSDPKEESAETVFGDGAEYFENTFIRPAISIPQNKIIYAMPVDYSTLAEEKIIATYLGDRTCYNAMPMSGKVVALSVQLKVKDAFSALVKNGTKAAFLWDEGYSDFVGMLTISDFINVLRHYYRSSPEDHNNIENQSISTWMRITKVKPLVKVNSSDSLLKAAELLIQEGVIPVFDENRQLGVISVLTRKRLLLFLGNTLFKDFGKMVTTPSFFRKTIREILDLKVGIFEGIVTVKESAKVIDALDLLVKREVSSLPVLNKDNFLVYIFEKFNAFQVAKEQHYLDMTIEEAIIKGHLRETGRMCSCTLDDTFEIVINAFVTGQVNRIMITKDKRGVVGMISISDVLKFLVRNPLDNSGLPSTTETIEDDLEGAVGGTLPEPSSSLDTTQRDSLDEESVAFENLKIENSKVE